MGHSEKSSKSSHVFEFDLSETVIAKYRFSGGSETVPSVPPGS